MVNKEKLMLLATIYMLLPGAAPDAMAENADSEKAKNKRSANVQKTQAATRAARSTQTNRRKIS